MHGRMFRSSFRAGIRTDTFRPRRRRGSCELNRSQTTFEIERRRKYPAPSRKMRRTQPSICGKWIMATFPQRRSLPELHRETMHRQAM